MEYAVDHPAHVERPFYEASVGSRPPPSYATFVALQDCYGRTQPGWVLVGFDVAEQTGAADPRAYISDFSCTVHGKAPLFQQDQFPQLLIDAPVDASPWSAELQELRENIGLPITALVEALNVTRPAFYSWLRGELPNRSNQQRIRVLGEIAQAWRRLNLGPMSRHWNVPAPTGNADLRSTLSREDLSLAIFEAHLQQLGVGKRLLPLRTSKPILRERPAGSGPSLSRRKAWGTTSSDAE